MGFYCVSINHKKADAQIRSAFAFEASEKSAIIQQIILSKSSQCVVLCTCNRTEIYFDSAADFDTVESLFSHMSGITRDDTAKYILRYADDSALRHLFSLAAGLESAVIGEDEILRQIKSAYAESAEQNAAGGCFNAIFQAAFACAKRIKTDTVLSKTSVSVASLAASAAYRFGKNIMVIGASGKIGSAVVKNLSEYSDVHIYAAARGHNAEFDIFPHTERLTVIDYSKRYEYFSDVDCVISATSSPHYTVTYSEAKKYLTKKMLFIDLAVPPDISSEITKADNVSLMGIDRFKELAAENNKKKLECLPTAKEMIAESVDELKKSMLFASFIHQKGTAEINTMKLLYALRDSLDYAEFRDVLNIVCKMI